MRWVAALIALTGAAAADPFCDAVLALDGQGAAPVLALAGTQVTCTRSLALGGGAQLHCGWPYPYRDAAASEDFEQAVASLDGCFDQLTPDLGVNHPDFYDLRLFAAGAREIGLSLKDKAALSETYVFLRIDGVGAP